MPEKKYEVLSRPLPTTNAEYQKLLRSVSSSGNASYTITHIFVDPSRNNSNDSLIIVRLKDA